MPNSSKDASSSSSSDTFARRQLASRMLRSVAFFATAGTGFGPTLFQLAQNLVHDSAIYTVSGSCEMARPAKTAQPMNSARRRSRRSLASSSAPHCSIWKSSSAFAARQAAAGVMEPATVIAAMQR